VLHVGVFALILWLVLHAPKRIVAPQLVAVTPVLVPPFIPPVMVPAPKPVSGGGGGGVQEAVPAIKGRLPQVAKTQVIAPMLLHIDHRPKLAVAPTVVVPSQVKMPINNAMPTLGMTSSPQIALASQGSGSGGGFGQGMGGGIGSGGGAGIADGSSGGYGGGVMSVGGGVTAPRLIHSVIPELSNAARDSRYQGTVSIQLIVDARGNPEDIHVVRRVGMGLDQKAVAAVRQYKFSPAMYQGHPVPVQIIVDVGFTVD